MSKSDAFRPNIGDGVPLRELAARVPGTTLAGTTLTGADESGSDAAGVRVTGITLGSAEVRPGDLFVAMPGTKQHGARFGAAAAEAGASAILTDVAGSALLTDATVPLLINDRLRDTLGQFSSELFGHPSETLPIIAITGTSGKTTTAYLTEAALRGDARRTGLIGTVEIHVGGEAIPSSLTTPDAPQLQGLFTTMLATGVQTAVMEVSSHALAQHRVGGTHFRVGVFTNLSHDHLDFHPTLEDYFLAKAELFGGTDPRTDAAVICVDDEHGARMARIARDAGLPVQTVSTNPVGSAPATGDAGSVEPNRERAVADWTAGASIVAGDGTQEFALTGPGGVAASVTLPLPGRYNVANALCAIAAAHAVGVPVQVAAAAIGGVAVPGRVQRIDAGQDFLVVVDYAHKPAALDAVIATLRQQAEPGARLAVVVGAGGDRDTAKRPLMGAAAAVAELLIVTDDNPRSEDPATIRAAVLGGARAAAAASGSGDGASGAAPRGAEIREIGDRAAAIVAAVEWARPGDIVLIAGKGHETGQSIGAEKIPFDDRIEADRALRARLGRGVVEQAGRIGADGADRAQSGCQ